MTGFDHRESTAPPGIVAARGTTSRRVLSLLLCAAIGGAGTCPGVGAAESWPTRPVRLMVLDSPGEPVDLVARPIAQRLAQAPKQAVVIDHWRDANDSIGAAHVAKPPADDHTLLHNRTSLDPALDLAPVTLIVASPSELMVHHYPLARTLLDYTVTAGTRRLAYTSAGNRSANPLVAEPYRTLAKVDMLRVAFTGSNPSVDAQVDGQVASIFIRIPLTVPFVQAGRLRAITVHADKRGPALPDTPTTAEAGITGLASSAAVGVLAPAGPPQDIVARLRTETARQIPQDETRDWLTAQRQIVRVTMREQFAAVIQEEIERHSHGAQVARVRLD